MGLHGDNKHIRMNGIEQQMVILFIIVVVGYVLRKIGMMGEEFDGKLSNFVIDVACPCLILSSTMGDKLPDKHMILPLLLISCASYALLLLAAVTLPRLLPISRDLRGLYGFMLTFGNVGFIGYPIVAAIFGPEAIFYAVILNFPNTFLIFTFGVSFVAGTTGKSSFNWKRLVSPAMICSYISILIVAMEWKVSPIISEPCRLLGNITIPGALLLIGSSMATIPVRELGGNRAIYILSALKLFLIPVALFYLFGMLGFDHRVNAINTIVCAMPVASYGTLFCIRYHKDVTTMAEATFITTLLSLFSIPLLSLVL